MTEYTVTWTIEVEADSKLQAAIRCRQMQLNPRSTATVFKVFEREEDDGNTDGLGFDLEDTVGFGSGMWMSALAEHLVRDLTVGEVKSLIGNLVDHLADRAPDF